MLRQMITAHELLVTFAATKPLFSCQPKCTAFPK